MAVIQSLGYDRRQQHYWRLCRLRRANPELLKGKKGRKIWPKMRLKDRIDAIIAHEMQELRAGGKHVQAMKASVKTELPISIEARRLNRARAR